jgi:hypothetical protein
MDTVVAARTVDGAKLFVGPVERHPAALVDRWWIAPV